MKNFVKMRRYYHGWLVTYPSEFVDWDFRTYREKFFDSCINDVPAYRKAQRFVKEIKQKIKEAEELDIQRELKA